MMRHPLAARLSLIAALHRSGRLAAFVLLIGAICCAGCQWIPGGKSVSSIIPASREKEIARQVAKDPFPAAQQPVKK